MADEHVTAIMKMSSLAGFGEDEGDGAAADAPARTGSAEEQLLTMSRCVRLLGGFAAYRGACTMT